MPQDDLADLDRGSGEIVVFIIDDQLSVATAISNILERAPDITTRIFSGGEDAIRECIASPPSVVLLDLVMPELDGLAVLRALKHREATSNLPVILLSSSENAEDKADAFRAGAHDYLVKIPEQMELLAKVRYCANAHRAQRERDEACRRLTRSQELLEKRHAERDEAHRQLTRSQELLEKREAELAELNNKLEVANRALETRALTDELTGVGNKRAFVEQIKRELARSCRSGEPFSLVLVDIDHFQRINDTHGHTAGDRVLSTIAELLSNSVRDGDIITRYEGEEFAIILPHAHRDTAVSIAERIRVHLEATTMTGVEGYSFFVTASFGVATVSGPEGSTYSIEELVDFADQALHSAKRAGRNRVVLAPPRLGSIHLE